MKKQMGVYVCLWMLLSACMAAPTRPEPAATAPPTSIPSPSATFTPSPQPTPSTDLAATATQEALQAKLDSYCTSGRALAFRFSPNEQWLEVVCDEDTLVIVRVDGSKKWDISSDELINPYIEYFVSITHWSSDGRYAYTSPDPHTDGYWEPFHQGVVLFRLDLETGEIAEVLPLGSKDWIFYSYAFSPDDRMLASIVTDASPVVLKIRDLQTGAERSTSFASKYNTGGAFAWSPDGGKLVFSITQYDTHTAQYVVSSILVWDAETFETTELITDHPGRLEVMEWATEQKLILGAELYEATQFVTRKYEFDLPTQTLTEIDP